MIGARIKRLEDPPLLTGRGRYVDDVVRPGMLHAVIVRSAHAHARIRGVDASRALAHPGVIACVTSADVADSWTTSIGDVDGALRDAFCVVREQFSLGRQTGIPLETRGLVAEWDGSAKHFTVWGPTKVPYFNRRTLAAMLAIDEWQID